MAKRQAFRKRIDGAQKRQTAVLGIFERAATELELVAQDQTELGDEIANEITSLNLLEAEANTVSRKARASAAKLRELFG